jgi:hypothetical protein
MCGPWKRCSPPKEVARNPPDDSALRMHVSWSLRAASRRPARNLKQESHRKSRRNRAQRKKPTKDRREATKSGGRSQGRKDPTCWLGCGRANITEAGARGRRAIIAPRERKLRRTYTPCGLCPRASPAWARALRIPGLEGTGGVARKIEAEASRCEHYRELIAVKKATPWLTDA